MQYTLKRSSRARSMRLAIQPDGAVVVTAPLFFGLESIEKFLAQHSAWAMRAIEKTKGRTVINIPHADIPRLKREALALAHERCAHYAKLYGFSYKKITIRAQKTRWGSCSKNGNLSFNYKIAALPAYLAEYIVVHEICHFGEMNHSRAFWALVARHVPDHASARRALRNIAFTHRSES
jgi:hypothetical protein